MPDEARESKREIENGAPGAVHSFPKLLGFRRFGHPCAYGAGLYRPAHSSSGSSSVCFPSLLSSPLSAGARVVVRGVDADSDHVRLSCPWPHEAARLRPHTRGCHIRPAVMLLSGGSFLPPAADSG